MCKKLNCWEFMNCGMEPGGLFSKAKGPCLIPQMMRYDGANGGRGAGRICWEIVRDKSGAQNALCPHQRQSCLNCKFYLRVHSEEEELITNKLESETV